MIALCICFFICVAKLGVASCRKKVSNSKGAGCGMEGNHPSVEGRAHTEPCASSFPFTEDSWNSGHFIRKNDISRSGRKRTPTTIMDLWILLYFLFINWSYYWVVAFFLNSTSLIVLNAICCLSKPSSIPGIWWGFYI